MGENKSKKMILVQKVDYHSYKELEKSNILPLIIDTKEDLSEDKKYKRLNDESNLYILNIEYLKWHSFELLRQSKKSNLNLEKDSLLFSDGTSVDIIRPVETFESEEKEGFLTKSIVGSTFISVDSLVSKILKKDYIDENENKKDIVTKEPEKVTISSQIVTANDYSIIREHHFLPFLIILTDFEYRVASKPFDGLYTKLKTNADGKVIMVIDPLYVKTLVDSQNMELNGIELLNGETANIDGIYGRDLNDNLGGFYINRDEFLSVEDYSSKILNSNIDKVDKMSEDKPRILGYWF